MKTRIGYKIFWLDIKNYSISLLLILVLAVAIIIINWTASAQKYPWIVSVVSLISTLFGSIVGYMINKRFKEKEAFDKAYASVVLIRSWIFEKLSNVTTLIKNLENRLAILNDETIDFSKNRKALIIVSQEIPIKDDLYQLDLKLIENIAFLKREFLKFEVLLQCLSLSINQYKQALRIKTVLKEMKELFFKKDIKSAQGDDITAFLKTLHRQLPGYLEQAKQAKEQLNKMLNGHQKNICNPLGIAPLMLDGKEAEINIIFDDLLISNQ